MSSMFGDHLKISIFGESHGEAIGVTIDGLPSGFSLDLEQIDAFMQRRAANGMPWATKRSEPDKPRILSGFYQGRTTGTPLCAMIQNQDTRSVDYASLATVPRPGHADLTATARYGGYQDPRGGGHFSGRLTAPLTFAGAVCMQILEQKKIHIFAHIDSIGEYRDLRFDSVHVDYKTLKEIAGKDFPVISGEAGEAMIRRIMEVKEQADSVGGVVECMACGISAGYGDPIFDSVESRISAILFSIPAVKGVEFGAGFDVSTRTGSENNDTPVFLTVPAANAQSGSAEPPVMAIRYKTNHAGGIEGGITNGMPVIFRVAFKPTPSIGREQESIDLSEKKNVTFRVKGRHDPCIVPRAVPVVEAACAIAVLDLIL